MIAETDDAAPPTALPLQDAEMFREQAEKIIRQVLPDGAVVLGRAGAAALRDEPDVLRADLWREYRLHTQILTRIGMIRK